MLRGVMAELERVANHFGDIGAICNDASFAIAHAHCGIFRERILAVSDQAFGHRLMMDRIIPGGVAVDITADAAAAIISAITDIEPHFAEIVRLYDGTPSLQDRTCTTGIVGHELVKHWAAGGYVGRASGRNFDARRDMAYMPYIGESLEVPVFDRGDVDARIWVRIREVEASFKLLKDVACRSARRTHIDGGPAGAESPAKASPSSRPFVATCSSGSAFRKERSCMAICATHPAFSGRFWKPRSKAISLPTSRSATSLSIARIRGTTSDAHLAPPIAVHATRDD